MLCAKLAVLCNTFTWGVTPFVVLQQSAVTEQSITISLPVYVVSLLATAGFSWMVAKHDSATRTRVRELEQKVAVLLGKDPSESAEQGS